MVMKEKYLEKINLAKELISSKPVTNLKNIDKKIELLDEMKAEYSSYFNDIKLKLESFLNNYNLMTINPNIGLLKDDLNDIESKISFLCNYNTSFEKMKLDRICYNIRNYQNSNLEYINKNIIDAIDIFREVGIDLTERDFNYSIFFHQYVVELLNNKDISVLNDLFEQLYWQSPSIIDHIEMNIKFLYLKNIKKFDFYVKKRQIEINKSFDMLCSLYVQTKTNYDNLIDIDDYLNLEDFKNKKLKLADYSDDKIAKLVNELSEGNFTEQSFRNLLADVKEYKNYNKFNFILDDIKEIFKEKEKYKNAYKLKLKEINKNEKKLFKLNLKYNKTNNVSVKEDLKISINSILDILKVQYVELDDCKFNELIFKTVFDKSSIKQVLELSSYYYVFISKCIKKHDLEVDVDQFINDLKDYVYDSNNSIINNVNMVDNYDFPVLICEKNRLMHILITPDLLDENNIDSLIEKLNIIVKSYDLKKTSISLDEIKCCVNVNDVLGK